MEDFAPLLVIVAFVGFPFLFSIWDKCSRFDSIEKRANEYSKKACKYIREKDEIEKQLGEKEKTIEFLLKKNKILHEERWDLIKENNKIIKENNDLWADNEDLRCSGKKKIEEGLNKSIEFQKRFLKTTSEEVKKNLEKINKLKETHENEIQKQKINLGLLKKENAKSKIDFLVDKVIEKELEEYDSVAIHLECKNNPAPKAAQDVKEARSKIKGFEEKYKKMKLEYDLLFELFPELDGYIERCENYADIQTLKDDYDYARSYLNDEEYQKLSIDERNQKALDNYINSRKKTKWQIGRDYEIQIAQEYEKLGYQVEHFGTKKINDLGRDLIAKNQHEILIIQCKYWSKEKTIHEKHICQLYGTAIQYKIENNPLLSVKPVFVTTIKLSETAKKFAQYLSVEVVAEKKFNDDFPRIKCNVSKSGEKIYHLPFDLQYDSVKIEKHKGEFYASTIEEATNKGFRRAKKWITS